MNERCSSALFHFLTSPIDYIRIKINENKPNG